MTYPEALKYLESFIDYEKLDSYDYKDAIKLERMKAFAGLLGDPQNGIRSIHVAGTKGKGSTAAFIYSILKKSGFKVGLYTSPHLVSFRERIRINDELISETELCGILEHIKSVLAKFKKEDLPTFFEVYTALAYIYFKERKVDFAVYETGMGGRLDATNIIEPLVSVITPISYEHTQKLGNTLSQIAAEKGGIIKNNSVCVSAPQEEEALGVIKDICNERNAKLVIVGRDILFEEVASSDRSQTINIFGMFGEYPLINLGLLGAHQAVNAAAAAGAIEGLRFRDIVISPEYIRSGLEDAKWEGRFEKISDLPLTIVDGAQNKASAKALAAAVKKIYPSKRVVTVLGVSKDKDIKGILEEILPISDSLVLTKSNMVHRALDPRKIKEHVLAFKDVTVTENSEAALNAAKKKARAGDMILVTGSLFVVGEIKACLQTTQTTQ